MTERFWGDGYHEYGTAEHYGHHQYTDIGQDYALFEVSCSVCGVVIFEFVHQQKRAQPDWIFRQYDRFGPPMSAQSWFKTSVRVIHDGERGEHRIAILEKPDEDKNMTVRSRPMTHLQFKDWKNEAYPS